MKHYEVIGPVSQSEVVMATCEEEFKLKILLVKGKNGGVDLSSLPNLLREFEILHGLHHQISIVTFGFGYGDNTRVPSILHQLCPNCMPGIVDEMSDIEKVCSIFEISLGMMAVRATGLIHLDLKPSSITD